MRTGYKLAGISIWICAIAISFSPKPSSAQQRLKLAYASVDTTNAVWYVAKEKGLYQKHGLDVELIFIPSSTTNIAALIAGDVQIANGVASNVASMAVGGVTLIMPAAFSAPWPTTLSSMNRSKRPQIYAAKMLA